MPPSQFDEFFKQFQEFLKKGLNKDATESDPLRTFIEERVGKPPSVLSWEKKCVVKEPHFWLLLFDTKVILAGNGTRSLKESDFKDEFGGPGRLLSAWQLRATSIWTEGIVDSAITSAQLANISTLGGLMVSMASVWFNHPPAKGVPHLISSLESLLDQASELVLDLDEVFVSSTIGSRQGREFKRLRGMNAKEFGPRSAEIVNRLSYREKQGDGHGDRQVDRLNKNKKRIPAEQWEKMSAEERKAVIEKRRKK